MKPPRTLELTLPVLPRGGPTHYGFALVLPFGAAVLFYVVPRGDRPSPGILAHERTHAEQARFLGWARFCWQYLQELRRNGYRRNAFEIEANMAEDWAYLAPGWTTTDADFDLEETP